MGNTEVHGRTWRRFWAGISVLLVVAMLVVNSFCLRIRQEFAQLRLPEHVRASEADDSEGGGILSGADTVTLDSDGDLLVVRAGSGPIDLKRVERASLQHALGAVPRLFVYDRRAGLAYVADGERRVHVVDQRFETMRILTFPGQVSSMAVLDEGGLAVCYGLTGTGPDYFVSLVGDSLKDEPSEGFRIGFCTRLLASGGDHVIYTTVNSRVGKLTRDGRQVWERVLLQRPVAVAASSKGLVAVGDRNGALTLLNEKGEVIRREEDSRFPLAQVAFSPDEELILTTDSRGVLFLHDTRGRLLCPFPPREGSGGISAFVAAAPDVVVLSGDNAGERIRLSGVVALCRYSALLGLLPPIDASLLLLFAAVIIASSNRASRIAARFLRRMHAGRTAYFLLAPTFGLLLVFNYYPVVTAFLYSFTTFSLSAPIQFVGMANFKTMLGDPYVWIGVKNMLILLIAGLAKTLTVPLLVAELVFWLSNDRLRQIMRTCFVVPAIVPGLVAVLLWKMIYDPSIGLLNKVLDAGGLSAYTHAWLAEEGLAIWSIVFAGFPWVNVFAFLILLGGLINISRDIHEAGALDGISAWRRFWHIDLPMITPQIKLLIVFVFIGSIQDFTSVLVFTGGGPGHSTYVPALQMFFQTAEGANLGYAAAIGVVLFALVLGATVLNLKLIKTEGS